MEHLADELDSGRLVRILFLKMHHKSEGAILEWRVGGTNNDGIPYGRVLVSVAIESIMICEIYQVMTLSGTGEAETPAGGSVCMRCCSIVSWVYSQV